jgi:hypothetical protein
MNAPGSTPQTDTKSFSGNYLLFRKDGQKLKRERRAEAARPPQFRHPSFASAEAEAQRLLGLYPESSFIILQEVARVKVVEQPSAEAVAWAHEQADRIAAEGGVNLPPDREREFRRRLGVEARV